MQTFLLTELYCWEVFFAVFGQGYVFHKGRFSNQTRLYAAPLTRHPLTIEMISAIATASGIFLRNRTVIYQNCKVGLLCFTFNVMSLVEFINIMEKTLILAYYMLYLHFAVFG